MDPTGRSALERSIRRLRRGQKLYIQSYQMFEGGYNQFTNTRGQRKNYFILYNTNPSNVNVVPVPIEAQIPDTSLNDYALNLPLHRLLNPTTPEAIYKISLLHNDNSYTDLYTRRVRTF